MSLSTRIKLAAISLVIASSCTSTRIHAQEIQSDIPSDGYCVNYPEESVDYHSKYDALIAYEDWNLDEFIDYLQWTLFTPETEDEYKIKIDRTIISESAGY